MAHPDLKTPYVSGKRTICEVHREILDHLRKEDFSKDRDKMISLLEEAYNMAKRMNDKLFEYNRKWADGMFKKNKNMSEKQEMRRRGR